jgi:hypothetical protein
VLFGLDDHWMSNIEADDHQDAARSGIVGTFLDWDRTDMSRATEVRLVSQYATWARGRGAIPMIDLYPPASVSLKSIAAGRQDSVLTAYAKALHRFNHPFLLRLFPEMNGPWETYSPGENGNTPRQLIAAWRHVYRLFRAHGATKVKFVWNPDKEPSSQKYRLRRLWPGKKYVNWVALDVFDRDTNLKDPFLKPVAELKKSVHDIRTLTKTKPLMIAESGAVNYSKKPEWIRSLFSKTARLGVKAIVYFNEIEPVAPNSSNNWRLDSSSSSLAVTKQSLAGPDVVWPGHNGGSLKEDDHLISRGKW